MFWMSFGGAAPECLCTVWKPTTACSCVHNRTVTDEMVPNYIKSFLLTVWLAPFSTLGWNQSHFVFIPNTQSYRNTYLRGSPDHLGTTKWKMMHPNTTFLGPGQLEDLGKTQDDLSYRSSGSTKDEMNRIGTFLCSQLWP